MNKALVLAGSATLALMAGSAQAGTLYIANMLGANENPPVVNGFSGTGFLVLNDAETIGTAYATHNINIPLTGGHIHRGTALVNGPVIFGFPAPASPVGPLSQAILPADIVALKSQGLYMNFHTAVNPGGAIRGTLNRVVLASSATNESQRAVANALDISAGYNSELDLLLMGQAVASSANRAAAFDDLSARTVYVQGRHVMETLSGFGNSLLSQSSVMSRAGAEGPTPFVTLGKNFGSRDAVASQAGAKISRPALLVGVGFGGADSFNAGVALGYSDGEERFSRGVGETEVTTTSAQVFLASSLGGLQFSGAAGYGWSELDTSRHLASLGSVAVASFDAKGWSLVARLSYPMGAEGGPTLTPYAQIDMQEAKIDAYAEAGAGAAGLVQGKRLDKMTAAEGGVEFTSTAGSGLTAQLQLGWRHLLDDGSDVIASRLVGSPVAFRTVISSPGKDAARIGASVSGDLAAGVSVSAGYEALIGRDNKNHALELRFVFTL